MNYIRPLDGLRAIAVLLVIVSHWFTGSSITQAIPFGEIGVDIFFVLSGFLISTILLKNRSENGQSNNGLQTIKQFVIRRTLRIFPIYYITIIALFILGERTGTRIREDWVYYFTYTSNFNFYFKGSWDGMVSHLWSLAVEEQFYLIWPWLMIFLKRQYLLPVIVLTFATGIISAKIFGGFGWVLTSSCFDAFGAGAFLAYDLVYKKGFFKKYNHWFLGAAVVLSLVTFFTYDERYIPIRTSVSLCTLCIIHYLMQSGSAGSRFFSVRPLVFIGKISYGVYLFHNIIPWLWESFLNKLNEKGIIAFSFTRGMLLIQEFIILIVFCWLSWILIERRINHLKRFFPYHRGDGKFARSPVPVNRQHEKVIYGD